MIEEYENILMTVAKDLWNSKWNNMTVVPLLMKTSVHHDIQLGDALIGMTFMMDDFDRMPAFIIDRSYAIRLKNNHMREIAISQGDPVAKLIEHFANTAGSYTYKLIESSPHQSIDNVNLNPGDRAENLGKYLYGLFVTDLTGWLQNQGTQIGDKFENDKMLEYTLIGRMIKESGEHFLLRNDSTNKMFSIDSEGFLCESGEMTHKLLTNQYNESMSIFTSTNTDKKVSHTMYDHSIDDDIMNTIALSLKKQGMRIEKSSMLTSESWSRKVTINYRMAVGRIIYNLVVDDNTNTERSLPEAVIHTMGRDGVVYILMSISGHTVIDNSIKNSLLIVLAAFKDSSIKGQLGSIPAEYKIHEQIDKSISSVDFNRYFA